MRFLEEFFSNCLIIREGENLLMKVIDNQLKSIFRKIGIIITKEDYNEDLELDSIQLVMLLVSM